MTRVRMDELTWPEYAAKLGDGSVVMLPAGALEQHGPHLPMLCDRLIPATLCERVAARIGGIVAPPLAYGCKSQPKSGGGEHLPGTTSLDGQTYVLLVRDILKALARHGATRLCVVNGHYENEAFLIEAIDLALRELRWDGIDVRVCRIAYWEFIDAGLQAILFPEGLASWALEHAAVMETSVMLHLHPELVRAELIPDHPPAVFPLYDVYPIDPRPIPASGALSPATSASAAKGEAVMTSLVSKIEAALRAAFELGGAAP